MSNGLVLRQKRSTHRPLLVYSLPSGRRLPLPLQRVVRKFGRSKMVDRKFCGLEEPHTIHIWGPVNQDMSADLYECYGLEDTGWQ